MTLPNSLAEKRVFEELKLVVFQLPEDKEGIRFGLNAHKVREVVEVHQVEQLPLIYSPYIGILNLRGIPIPILDVNLVLNKASKPQKTNLGSPGYRIVVCETLGKLVGVLTRPTIRMIEKEDQDIFPPRFAQKKVKNEYITGIVDHNDTYIFMLNIEAILDEFEEVESPASRQTPVRYQGKRVLIVEDSVLFQKKLTHLLEKVGFSVTLASNGQEGLQILSQDSLFDIIFADIEMPLLNGIEMVRKIKLNPNFAKIPILFHSSISNKELIEQIRSEDLGHYITKFSEPLILEKLANCLG